MEYIFTVSVVFLILVFVFKKLRKTKNSKNNYPEKQKYYLYVPYFIETPLEMLLREGELISISHENELPSLPMNCCWIKEGTIRGKMIDVEFLDAPTRLKNDSNSLEKWYAFIKDKEKKYKQFLVEFRKIFESDLPYAIKYKNINDLEEKYKPILGNFRRFAPYNRCLFEIAYSYDFIQKLSCNLLQGFSLIDNGYTDIQKISNSDAHDIEKLKGFSSKSAKKVIENAKNLHETM